MLSSKVQAPLDTVQTDWITSLGTKMVQVVEKAAAILISLLLSELKVPTEEVMCSQIGDLTESQLPDKDAPADAV